MTNELKHQVDASELGLELLSAAALPLPHFVSAVTKLLRDQFDLSSVALLSYHHSRWTFLMDSESSLPTKQLILGEYQMQLESQGFLSFESTKIPDWAAHAMQSALQRKFVVVLRLFTKLPSESSPVTNGALFIQTVSQMPKASLEQLLSISRHLGHALDLAIKNSCQQLTMEVTTRLFDSPDLNSCLHRVASLAKTTLQAQAATIWLLDQTTNLVRVGATTGLKDTSIPSRQIFLMRQAEAVPCDMILNNRAKPRLIDDVGWLESKWEEHERYIDETATPAKSVLYTSILVRPSRSQSRVVGVLRVTNRQAEHVQSSNIISFTNEDVIWATHICDLLALIIHATSAAQKLLRLYEMVMHGTKSALEAINDNLISLGDCQGVLSNTPEDLKYALPDSISFVDDLRWQVKRTELWQRSKPEWEPQRVLIGSKVLPKAKELAERMAPVHDVDKVIFSYDAVGDVPAVAADANALLAVMRNLVENSLKYCRDRICTISIRIEHDENWVRLYVDDDGIGIPQEDQDYIFWGGYRGDRAMRHHPKGAGIGLSWSQKVMRDIGGTLSFLAAEKKTGCRFVMEIPVWREKI